MDQKSCNINEQAQIQVQVQLQSKEQRLEAERTSRRAVLKLLVSLPFTFSIGLGSNFIAAAQTTSVARKTKVLITKIPLTEIAHSSNRVHCFSAATNNSNAGSHAGGFALQLASGECVAFASHCPELGCQFDLIENPDECHQRLGIRPSGPSLNCSCHDSVFDLLKDGAIIHGPPDRSGLHRYRVKQCHDQICVLAGEEVRKA